MAHEGLASLRMFLGSVLHAELARGKDLEAACNLVWQHPQVLAEIHELMGNLRGRVSHLGASLDALPRVPLVVHAQYTRREILAATGVGAGMALPLWQTGVFHVPHQRTDLLAVTLDKSDGQFSPTTRYRDYAISPDLVHWESQSVTRAASETGQRYQHHARLGWNILLFARHRAADRAFYFLGPATYVRHEGERPMAVTWRLRHSLPGDLFSSFAAAVA